MDRKPPDDALMFPEMAWASWDFYPSQWSAGTLLVNSLDDRHAAFVAIAAPGVSLVGERGFEVSHWRRAEWADAEAYFDRAAPLDLARSDLGSILAEVPPDFVDWTADATAAHVERLWAFQADRPEEVEAVQIARSLERELDIIFPGMAERLRREPEAEIGQGPRVAITPSTASRTRRFPAGLTLSQIADPLVQLLFVGLVYGFYRLVREPWAPRGAQVDLAQAVVLPIGQFVLWLYGYGHVLLPVVFLAWIYIRRPRLFTFARNTLVLASLLSIAGYLIYAPQPVYGVKATSSIPSGALATMPALHLAVALALACLGVSTARGRIAKIAWGAYPLLVVLVLVLSDLRYPELTLAFAIAVVLASLLISRHILPRLRLPSLRAPAPG
jgi:hypothetical protein